MAFADQALLAEDTTYRNKVRQAVIYAAMDIQGEAQGATSDEVFGKRQSLASRVIQSGGGEHVEAFAWLVSVFNGGIIQANSIDSDFQFAVNSLFNDVAGIRSTD